MKREKPRSKWKFVKTNEEISSDFVFVTFLAVNKLAAEAAGEKVSPEVQKALDAFNPENVQKWLDKKYPEKP